jgi:putative transposase
MANNPNKQQHRSVRLKDYDYSQAGAYFITICTDKKECVLGNVIDGEMVLNDYGRVIEREWLRIPDIRPGVELDEFVIMPNHMHGIVVIAEANVGATNQPPLPKGPTSKAIGTIVGAFKAAVTRRINALRGAPHTPVWQRNYYEHVIRDEDDLNRRREYIVSNPLHWDSDWENPQNLVATYSRLRARALRHYTPPLH